VKMAYYFEPSTGSRGDERKYPGHVFKIVKEVDVLDMEMRTEPLLWLIRENRARFGISPLGIICAGSPGLFGALTRKFEDSIKALHPTTEVVIKDISDGSMGWGLGW